MSFKDLPIKVLQIGEGNFLRAFAEYIIETADEQGIINSSVVISQARGSDFCDVLNAQNCEYNILTRGVKDGETIDDIKKITCVRECINPKKDFAKLKETACLDSLEVIISNTTEAGITYAPECGPADDPPSSFPAKLAVLLHERYLHFSGDADKGVLLLPVELIEHNGDRLKEIVLKHSVEWGFDDGFIEWLNNACCFANTLVDRIVSGYPKDGIEVLEKRCGFEDKCMVACEPFLFWAIECEEKFRGRFPIDKLGLNIVYSSDITPYKIRKVRILNGAHTVSVLAAYLSGHNIVRDMMNDKVFADFISVALNDEIIPTINLPSDELNSFALSVTERFKNPFIDHRLLDISLNSVSKFKARCLGSMTDYIALKGKLPRALTFGLAALIQFYNGEMKDGKFVGTRGNDVYEIKDSSDVTEFFSNKPSVEQILSNESFWGFDLNTVDGLAEAVEKSLESIRTKGMYAAIQEI
ncbi:MAG: tagaturonate reductase [Clostridia bacterium]|nr:tagaturonate reductase [Clostridia bacterium]